MAGGKPTFCLKSHISDAQEVGSQGFHRFKPLKNMFMLLNPMDSTFVTPLSNSYSYICLSSSPITFRW